MVIYQICLIFQDENAPLDEKHIEFIYKMCIKNFEECMTRYPEHFKSIYRLALIFKNGPEKVRDLSKCNQLLLGTYTTELGHSVQGLFTDRKNNNLFNVSICSCFQTNDVEFLIWMN